MADDLTKKEVEELMVQTSMKERIEKSSKEEGGGVGFTANPDPNAKKPKFTDLTE